MPTLKNFLDRAVRTAHRLRFDRACQAVLKTPPIAVGHPEGASLVSMLQHKDVLMYLAAVKSFARWVPVARVHLVNDGTLSPADTATLRAHIPEVEILDIEAFRSARCPVGGCWERLLAITELSQNAYVIQLDADTLAIGDIPEVRAHVAAQRSFTIGTWDHQQIERMTETNRRVKQALARSESAHVQLQAESAFDQLKDFESLKYVRGCAGFMGFAPGSLSRPRIEEWSMELRQILGPVWETWGSEQVMANLLIANTPEAEALPHPKYCNCERVDSERTAFIHFVGSCRFRDGAYAAHVFSTVSKLKRA